MREIGWVLILWPYVRGAVSLQLGAGRDQSLAVLVALVLCEVLDEAASQILGLLFPLSGICVGVAGIEDGGVNTGWNGTGKRISIKDTRGIIDAILSGAINEAPTKKIPYFDFEVPTALPGVDPAILDPRDTYADAAQWEEKAKDLAGRFIKNFAKYEGNEHGKALVSAGPQL